MCCLALQSLVSLGLSQHGSGCDAWSQETGILSCRLWTTSAVLSRLISDWPWVLEDGLSGEGFWELSGPDTVGIKEWPSGMPCLTGTSFE